MPDTFTPEQQDTYDSIDGFLEGVLDKSQTTYERLPGDKTTIKVKTDFSQKRRIENGFAEIERINSSDSPTEEQKARRDKVAEALVKAYEELEKLEANDAVEVLGKGGVTDAAAQKTLLDLKALDEAADNNQIQSFNRKDAVERLKNKVDAEGARIIRTAYQCFLLYNVDFFQYYHQLLLDIGAGATSSGYLGADADGNHLTAGYIKKGSIDKPRLYLMSEDEQSTIINNKLSLCPGNKRFAQITTDEYAGLQPMLRLYKVYRNHQPKNKAASNKDAMVEIEFRNKTGLEGILSKVTTVGPTGKKDSAFGKGAEVGIKSFDWKFIGSDPFTATRDIEATLVLHAQHFSSLTTERKGTNLNNRKETIDYKYLDLVLQPDCKEKANRTTRQDYNDFYEPGCYEIRMDVGYAPQSGGLRDAICCQQDTLYLVHVDHSFEFGDDGTLNLTINYRGRLESVMNDKKFNVLLPGGGFDTETDKTKTAPIIASYNKLEEKLAKARNDQNEKEIKRLERIREALFVDLRQYIYAIILETMEDQGMIHSFEMTPKEFERFAAWKDPRYKAFLPDKIDPATRSRQVTTGKENDAAVQFISATEAQGRDPEEDAAAVTLDEVSKQAEEKVRQRLQRSVDNKKYVVNFIYLGDLIATVVANTLGELPQPRSLTSVSTAQSELFTLTGGLVGQAGTQVEQDIDTEAGFTQPNVDIYKAITDNLNIILGVLDYTDGEGDTKQVNLAHIPISLESFQDFMMKNVISKNSDYYSMSDFFDDVISDLVTDMFTSDCFSGLLSVDSRTSTTLYTSKADINSSLYAKDTKNYKELLVHKMSPRLLPFGKNERCSDMKGEPKQYLVINTVNTYPRGLAGTLASGIRGDNVGDENRGIMHFTYGMNKGILKKVSFSKTDQEFLPEARFAAGSSILNQLSNVYDANFQMLGNSMFKPGELIYFDPNPMGVGSPWQYKRNSQGKVVERSWANIMGIGGYHLITEVAHSISPGQFDTNVKARWVTSGEGNVLPSETDPGVQGE